MANQLNDNVVPQLDLATTFTSEDLNDSSINLNYDHAIFLMKFPYLQNQLDVITFILFLSTFDEERFDFELKTSLNRTIEKHQLDCRLLISQKEDLKNGIPCKLIFKIELDSLGNFFYIQIMDTSHYIKYDKIKFKRKTRRIDMFLYTFEYTINPNLNTPYKILFPETIFHKLSILFNHKNHDPAVNQFTALLFYRFSPFHPKTVSRNKFYNLSPCDDLFYIFQNHSGYLCYVLGDGPFNFKGKSVSMFSWFQPFFIDFVSKTNAIELDCTFKVLSPYKACIPQMIVKNTGVPMGLIAGPSEDFYIYSMLFEALKKIDKTNKLFKLFQKIPYVTDEHLSFNKLEKVYNLQIFKCFTHLIRSIGAHSSLAFLFRDILYCYSEKEFIKSFIKNCYMLKKLYSMHKKKKRR